MDEKQSPNNEGQKWTAVRLLGAVVGACLVLFSAGCCLLVVSNIMLGSHQPSRQHEAGILLQMLPMILFFSLVGFIPGLVIYHFSVPKAKRDAK